MTLVAFIFFNFGAKLRLFLVMAKQNGLFFKNKLEKKL